ncbi:MAG: respiratory nitrate reductase subunit gamma [Candidatus Thioglobus sp.]|jgi:nitrate reductase gamma subunit|uniref:respiratory nitrate reductase subunit gamma n=1 Tax=Candidatus Thioglobus sp. TaxID=2026721 RepID=UPI0001BAC577|nr:respiratory nitrate reductase subunit gamma [Candidatus Thioglobus sp.]ACX30503.1 nitrate reductase gamma subunit [uncultured Candidatus Thioglobus sp.]EEZ79696.1 MAG: Nitrate reductase gamma subunit [uncultured Candidatus Thioglobus sp.]MBT3186519.1 respiratory nitrate reductase subunit gamma [Candidatus Thioglobus sp.]MBT3431429.1 respiratory nitrate reductase subunit gamma [Candidatus Thioglobus sp.]MBT3965436.1 respiratory nitrate reductase subunit gamma [Candidatus Thioglobus sp.]
MTLDNFLFGVYPYIAGVVFILGSWIRFDREQYTWKADSSQLLGNKGMVLASNLFHVGIIGIFFGHAAGMLLPHSWWQLVATDVQHQYIAIYAGFAFGGMAAIGAALLFYRRMTNDRVKAVSRFRDNFVIFWLLLTALLGLNTISGSMHHAETGDVSIMLTLAEYVKSIATLSVDPSLLAGVPYTYKLHMLFGMTIFLVFPFTRLVHVWSVPVTYLMRPYQIVRRKRMRTN